MVEALPVQIRPNTVALGSASRDWHRVGKPKPDARGVERRGAELALRAHTLLDYPNHCCVTAYCGLAVTAN